MLRLEISKGLPWIRLFQVANLFGHYLGLTKYDAFRLAYSAVGGHNVLIQGPQSNRLWILHNKLYILKIPVVLYTIDGISVQIDRKIYEPMRMGWIRKGKEPLWQSKPKEFLIFRSL